MCPEIIAIGEILVEVMRKNPDLSHSVPGICLRPYPSGAPAIFTDAAANLGASSGFIGVVGEDKFGQLLLSRLRKDGVDTSRILVAKGCKAGIAFIMYYWSGARKLIFHLRHLAAGQLSPVDVRNSTIGTQRSYI